MLDLLKEEDNFDFHNINDQIHYGFRVQNIKNRCDGDIFIKHSLRLILGGYMILWFGKLLFILR